MDAIQDVKDRVRRLNELLVSYIPPRGTWNPADEAVFKPIDLYRVLLEEAQDIQLKAIKYTFIQNYTNNDFYHRVPAR